MRNRGREVFGAPCCAECLGGIHSAPFGNWGVDSNAGSRFNGDQFAGWRSGDHWEWNSCRNDFPPPDCAYYNAAGCTQQISAAADEQLYAAFSFVSGTDNVAGCAAFDGSQFTLSGNYMDMWELDPLDDDELVGFLNYPNLTATLNCTFFDCGPNSSGWQSPTGGDTGLLSASLQMTVSGVYEQEPITAVHDGLWNAGSRHSEFNRQFFQQGTLPRGAAARRSSGVLRNASYSSGPNREAARPQINPLSGTVAGNVSGPKGPIVGARVMVVNKRDSAVELRTVRTDEGAKFKIENLSPGRHEIVFV